MPYVADQGGRTLSTSDLYPEGWEQQPGLDLGRRYAKAPIAEAIMEFHVVNRDDLRLDDLAKLQFAEGYGKPSSIYNIEIEGEYQPMAGPVSAEGQQSHVGFAFQREDGSRRIQVGATRFSFIWRGSYTYWDEFLGEAEAAWLVYREAAAPTLLRGIGVRFVNHIDMPDHAVEIKDYLRMSVDVPAYLPQQVSNLFMQVDIPLERLDVAATVTSAMLASVDYEGGLMLLDIDVKAGVMMETSDPGFTDAVTATLTRLRLAKNWVFEACITDATRGRIS